MSRRVMTFIALAVAVLMIPTVAFAAAGSFSSGSGSTAAVTATNTASTGKGVYGRATSTSSSTHYGVVGNAAGSGGIGVFGTGSKYGVYSKGHLGILAGKALKCSACVDTTDLAAVPAVRAYRSAALGAFNADWTAVPFDTDVFDNASMHDTVTNPTRLIAPVTGLYLVTGQIMWEANATGVRWVRITKNGAIQNHVSQSAASSQQTVQNITALLSLTAGQYVEIEGYQNSGETLSISAGSTFTSGSMHRVSA